MERLNTRLRAMMEFIIGTWKAFITSLDVAGIKASVLLWGAVGAVVNAMMTPGTWPFRLMTGFVGTIFSVLFGPIVAHVADFFIPDQWNVFFPDILPASGFLCGLVGMTAAQAVLESATHAKATLPKFINRRLK